MLQELSVVEQRYLAVREVLDGAKVTDVATRYGVDQRTGHRWLVRSATEGLAALSDRNSRPDRCPHQIAPEIEARIVELRRAHPGRGPRTIRSKLRGELEQLSRGVACNEESVEEDENDGRGTPGGPESAGVMP